MTSDLQASISTAIASMEGWCTPEKAFAMAELILEAKPNLAIELGVFGGRSLIPQGIAMRENGFGVVVGIDPWRVGDTLEGNLSEADKEWWAGVDLHMIHGKCMEEIWRNHLELYCVILRSASQHVVSLFDPSQVDILHIDGTHSDEASCRDVSLYLPLVRPKGYIWLDDTDWTTTKKAQALLLEQCTKLKDVGTCALYQKNDHEQQ